MKFSKRLTALLITLVMLITGSSVAMIAYGATTVCAINAINFPDANFRAVITDWCDDNLDGYLSDDEISGFSVMPISGMLENTCGEDAKIENLKGIEYFTNCKYLRAGGIGLKSLDVSQLSNLIELTIHGNELESIDISNNIYLEILNCSSNELTNLDASYNGKLTRIDAYSNHISEIELSANAGSVLSTLRIQQNEFTELDVSNLYALRNFNCSNNHLSALDLSRNTNIVSATEAFIGNQHVKADARIENSKILVRFDVPNWQTNLISTSVDTYEELDEETITLLGYNGADFTPADCDDIANGIDYYYNTGLATAESMNVNVEVNRDFWQVKFFTDETKETMYKKEIVFTGQKATAPQDIEIPQCQAFAGWSEDFSNVTEDMEVYAVWVDDHDIRVLDYEGGLFFFNCIKCEDQEVCYSFVDYVNFRSRHELFPPILDRNNDGIINAKDYAKLINELKENKA